MSTLPLCACGCGERVALAVKTQSKLGLIKGQPARFVKNHNGIARPLADRFWDKVIRDPETGCWEWTGSRNKAGYGKILGPGGAKGKLLMAHRVVYELLIGPIPDGLVIDHLCRNHGCVNPAHMEPVTTRENLLRGTGASAQAARKTHCPAGHPYAGDNLYLIPSTGARTCRSCARERERHRIRRAA